MMLEKENDVKQEESLPDPNTAVERLESTAGEAGNFGAL